MNEVEEVKRRTDIVELISQYLELKKAGSNLKALCPFHHEKTPSFMVSPEKQIYKCFGCQKGGDIFDFVMEIEKVDFGEALKILAEKAGVTLVSRRPEFKKDEKTRLYQINRLTAAIYHKILLDHKKAELAREYLKNRKVSLKTIKDFKLGFAPSVAVVRPFLLSRGFTEKEIEKAGSPDRFKGRIIFPIFDSLGKVVGFTGRVLDRKDEPKVGEAIPKYLNTPETVIFHKGGVLYGLNLAKEAIKKAEKGLIVEGQMDVILSHEAGVKTAIASSGTALTRDHLLLLRRFSPQVVFSFDRDEAGVIAQRRAIDLGLSLDMSPGVVVLEGFKDAGEAIEKEPSVWRKAVREEVPAMEWLIEEAFQRIGKGLANFRLTALQKKNVAREILPFLGKIADPVEKTHYLGVLAKRLGIGEKSITQALNRAVGISKFQAPNPQEVKEKSPATHLLGLLMFLPQGLEIVKDIEEEVFEENKTIYQALTRWYNSSSKPDPFSPVSSPKLSLSEEERKRGDLFVFEIETNYSDIPREEIIKEIQEIAERLKGDSREKLKADFASQIRQAQAQGDLVKAKKLLKELQEAI